ncbi:hypothetical protein L6654_31030 [Bradyrhizobium sp. WYCCWR 13023]|uniref:Uncharacterized protein n=1 Tax=Bradyrhizobium zhengyangense TaxID=2911009 RepID=A0A9X1RBI3_9BRAD|nr:hypothetical protein [Bradyrhizobium zhengyangense]MCG2631072.1 hypothetical protein [Bradyrhizobium zhengyangense]
MTVVASKVVSSLDAAENVEAKAEANEFIGVALFCGIGLLISLTVVLLDQITPVEWF